MVLLSALIAIVGGESIGAVFGAFTAPMWITLASDLIAVSPYIIEALESAIPAFVGVGTLVAKGLEDVVIGPLLSKGFQQWVANNGDMAIKMQEARDAQDR